MLLLQLLLRVLLLPELLELPLVQLELLLHHHLLRARSRVGATLRAPPPAGRRDVHLTSWYCKCRCCLFLKTRITRKDEKECVTGISR